MGLFDLYIENGGVGGYTQLFKRKYGVIYQVNEVLSSRSNNKSTVDDAKKKNRDNTEINTG